MSTHSSNSSTKATGKTGSSGCRTRHTAKRLDRRTSSVSITSKAAPGAAGIIMSRSRCWLMPFSLNFAEKRGSRPDLAQTPPTPSVVPLLLALPLPHLQQAETSTPSEPCRTRGINETARWPDSETLCADAKKNATPEGRQALRVPPVPDRETGHAAPEPVYEPLINSKMVAEVPLAGPSFAPCRNGVTIGSWTRCWKSRNAWMTS